MGDIPIWNYIILVLMSNHARPGYLIDLAQALPPAVAFWTGCTLPMVCRESVIA